MIGGWTTRQVDTHTRVESVRYCAKISDVDGKQLNMMDFLIRFDGRLIARQDAGIGFTLGCRDGGATAGQLVCDWVVEEGLLYEGFVILYL